MNSLKNFIIVSNVFCAGLFAAQDTSSLSNKNATAETQNLYKNLWQLMDKGVMFGHQDDLGYGVNWRMQDGRSDVKETAGDYPAVFGWDVMNIESGGKGPIDIFSFAQMKKMMEDVYNMGGINTVSWHANNPLTGKTAWDNTKGGVKAILPGGEKHQMFLNWLDLISDYLASVKGKDKKQVPILWRPYHELTGSWFWWGKNNCTSEEFKQLWKMTYDYLTKTKGRNNLIWIYNTSDFNTKEEFLEFYPGDEYVDMISFDIYELDNPVHNTGFVERSQKQFAIMDEIAKEHHKIPALAETGYEQIPYNRFWTKTLTEAIGNYKISYVLAWRNHGLTEEKKMHYYVPYKGHPNEQDFRDFYNLGNTLFLKDIQKTNVYK
ncbi:glycosyl hydrolase [Chryseobacterium mucoviscidosis]|uniref:Mannan endo-1,4-beta-mannosidase n=1 Tax=Chryseobacterium mucoviscidosis TaxID=1945581 RepID=A0A202CD15_9FLAO|nr:glycosyl hydrolase [Chryseobacterium mucoviscidosis]OVE61701.1 beta-mannosidase [Chryseobacterium mucoviscidosis]